MAHLDITIPVRWNDLDAYGHVNNAAVLRLLEEARISAFWSPSDEQVERGAVRRPSQLDLFDATAPLLTLIASQRLEYHRPMEYLREGALVRLWVSRTGGASFDVDYLILRTDDPEASFPYVSARTTIVVVERERGRATRLTDEVRVLLDQYTGEPLEFRS
ncbi:acyl-CoA thioesterase [Brachybacterium endophyticum]|uniref:Acyl-CoA thioesterase n=1 Tax=Brachybacterium endophyticum TaxID=2182385 RepID=A0A2U2RLV0_9MICO|nr:thioesterase family protein [Brachybacterium endophyticum]PWH06849.1 acyl-CoA thioesterase [Brachybacterium endophyticum]